MKITRGQLKNIIVEEVANACPECAGSGECPHCVDGYDGDEECQECGTNGQCADCSGTGRADGLDESGFALREVHGSVQSEPEFGTLLDAFHALEDKGFGAREIAVAMAEYAHGTKRL